MPRVYYGLTRGAQTYRFIQNSVFNLPTGDTSNVGDALELLSPTETNEYVNAVGVKINETQAQIIIRGDYNELVSEFTLLNTATGVTTQITGLTGLSLQPSSYLGDYSAQDNQDKQITVLHDLSTNEENIVYASVDYSEDGIYNWVRIGKYTNGLNGKNGLSIYLVADPFEESATTYDKMLVHLPAERDIQIGDFLLDEEGNMAQVYQIEGNNLTIMYVASIKGPQGEPGVAGQDGQDGVSPQIINNVWWIGNVNTGVRAAGEDGINGQDGKAFAMQSGLFSTIENQGKPNNVSPEGEALQTLPTLPSTSVTGNGYVVYDPLTTPLSPYYDLYWANNGDSEWTIIHPFSGISGQNGTDGLTPQIIDGVWWIGNVNTGVAASGVEGPQGEPGNTALVMTKLYKTNITDDQLRQGDSISIDSSYFNRTPNLNDAVFGKIQDTGNLSNYYMASGTITSVTGPTGFNYTFRIDNLFLITGPQGTQGLTGATPSISVSASALPIGTQPTATRGGTNENPTITFGIPTGVRFASITRTRDNFTSSGLHTIDILPLAQAAGITTGLNLNTAIWEVGISVSIYASENRNMRVYSDIISDPNVPLFTTTNARCNGFTGSIPARQYLYFSNNNTLSEGFVNITYIKLIQP